MSEGPTEEQLTRLWHSLLRVQRLASDPGGDGDALRSALADAYGLSNEYAVFGIVSYARGRFEALEELARSSPFGAAAIEFPRAALLAARPQDAPASLHAECVDLIEAEVRGADIEPLVARLVDAGGLDAFRLLNLVCVALGNQLVRLDPTLGTMDDLLARETQG